jgi:anti-sigma regulatory factor (Ser/Thr protein kinase)
MTSALIAAEKDKELFGRQVVTAVTGGKFHLVDPGDIPAVPNPRFHLSLAEQEGHRQMRAQLRQMGEEAGLAPDAVEELVLAAGEAATNTVKHGLEGSCQAAFIEDGVVVRVADKGPGIGRAELPQSLFRAGFSTKVSLGLGYTVILEVMDEVWLATGPSGTIIQMVKRTSTSSAGEVDLEALLDRFG